MLHLRKRGNMTDKPDFASSTDTMAEIAHKINFMADACWQLNDKILELTERIEALEKHGR
jgi:hypothetical protein